MDSSSLINRDRRRKAAASRKAARENSDNESGSAYQGMNHGHGSQSSSSTYQTPTRTKQPQRQPLESNLLSSLSQALTNIDKHNNDYFSRQDGSDAGGAGGYDSETIAFSSPMNNNNDINAPHHSERKQKYTRLPPPPSQFSSYLKFNRSTLNCLMIFAVCYLLVLICCAPMISTSNLQSELATDDDAIKGAKHHIKRGASFLHIRGRKQFLKVKEELGTLKERAIHWEEEAKQKARELEEKEVEIIDSLAGVGDGGIGHVNGEDAKRASLLLDHAIKEFDAKKDTIETEEWDKKQTALKVGQHDHWKDATNAWDAEFQQDAHGNTVVERAAAVQKGRVSGFMVLGMHRSGTSMLSGLLVKGFGYETGGPLIGASVSLYVIFHTKCMCFTDCCPNICSCTIRRDIQFDNEKGFYERIDVVLQNDEFMTAQRVGWSSNVIAYDSDKALQHKEQGKITFKEGRPGLAFLNNPHRITPYLQKDPRMCITLPTWLKLLNDKPAIVFTYRHPLEVAMSLKHREQNFTIEHGLRLWIIYNMRALQNSEGLCKVYSTNEAVFKDPLTEVQRIKNELIGKCRVLEPPTHQISEEVVNQFVDPKLQHNSKERKAEESQKTKLKEFGKGCIARDFESEYEEHTVNRKAEVEMYLMAMQIYCDLEKGTAYRSDYEWPDLADWHRPTKVN